MAWEIGFNTTYQAECDLDTFLFLSAIQGTMEKDKILIEARYIREGLIDNPHAGFPVFAFEVINIQKWEIIGLGERGDSLTFDVRFLGLTIFSDPTPDGRSLDLKWEKEADAI
jgi:hypothetical protein